MDQQEIEKRLAGGVKYRTKGEPKTVSGTEWDWQNIGTFLTKDSIVGPQGVEVQKIDHSIGSHN